MEVTFVTICLLKEIYYFYAAAGHRQILKSKSILQAVLCWELHSVMTDHVAVFFAPHAASESGFLWEQGRRESSPECRAAGLLHLSRGHFPSIRAPEGGVRPIWLPASIIQMRERKRRAPLCQHSMPQVKITVNFPSHCPTGWWGHKYEKRLQKLWCDFSHRDFSTSMSGTRERNMWEETFAHPFFASCSPAAQ